MIPLTIHVSLDHNDIAILNIGQLYEHLPRQWLNESEKKNTHTQSKQNIVAVKKRKCGMVVDGLMMRRKILFWANPVLSGFTSDVKA